MKEKIIAQVKSALITTLKLHANEALNIHANLKEELGLDSMSSLMFLMTLEDSIEGFVINAETLSENDLVNIVNVANYIEKECNSNRNAT